MFDCPIAVTTNGSPAAGGARRTGVRLIDSGVDSAAESGGSGVEILRMESPPVYRPELPWGGLGDMGRTMHGGMASTMMGSLNHAGALHMCTAAVRRSWGGSSPSPMFKLLASNALPAERIMGVETGGCPHTAIREDIRDPAARRARIRHDRIRHARASHAPTSIRGGCERRSGEANKSERQSGQV